MTKEQDTSLRCCPTVVSQLDTHSMSSARADRNQQTIHQLFGYTKTQRKEGATHERSIAR